MVTNDIDPLYKILCLALLFAVPLAPAWGLYRITPGDKFMAKGNFNGFKINATGSAAIYIVLFSAIYLQISPIITAIDKVKVLNDKITGMNNQIARLMDRRPWTVECDLTLMDADKKHPIDPLTYADYVHEESIICFPRTFKVYGSKMVEFYLDDEEFNNIGDTIQSGVFITGFGTTSMPIPKKSPYIDKANHIIRFKQTFQKTQSDGSQITDINNHRIPVLTANNSNIIPPHP